MLEALAHDDDYQIQMAVAANPACPLGVVMGVVGLAASGDELLMSDLACESAAANPVCPEPVLRRLAHAHDQYLRTGAAANPNCPLELLDVLSVDDTEKVRAGAALNPRSAGDVLARLVSDTAPDVAATALMNPSCPEHALRRACGENLDGGQRHNVGVNPSCPPDLMERIFEDAVRHVALSHACVPRRSVCRSWHAPRAPACGGCSRHTLRHPSRT